MKVIMKDTVASPHEFYVKGQMYDLKPEKAIKFVDRGLADFLEKQQLSKRKTTSLPHGEKG